MKATNHQPTNFTIHFTKQLPQPAQATEEENVSVDEDAIDSLVDLVRLYDAAIY